MDYKKINFLAGNNVEDAVNELLGYKAKGILACGEFNGIMLYSNTVTMNTAYIQVCGKTKAEVDKAHQDWMDERKRKEREHQEQIPILTEEWRIRGRFILSVDKWEYWDKIVPIRLSDLYKGMELGECLKIVKMLNKGCTLANAKKEIESQDHSCISFGLVCTMVKEFCDRGQEFCDYVR